MYKQLLSLFLSASRENGFEEYKMYSQKNEILGIKNFAGKRRLINL